MWFFCDVQQLIKRLVVYLDIESFNYCEFFSFHNASKSELHLFRLLHAQAHAMYHLPTIVCLDIHDFTKLNNGILNTISKLTSNYKNVEILL